MHGGVCPVAYPRVGLNAWKWHRQTEWRTRYEYALTDLRRLAESRPGRCRPGAAAPPVSDAWCVSTWPVLVCVWRVRDRLAGLDATRVWKTSVMKR